MTAQALELEIEEAWNALTRCYRPRAVYLTSGHRLVWGHHADQVAERYEVGTYGPGIGLADFREDVFHVWNLRGRCNGRG